MLASPPPELTAAYVSGSVAALAIAGSLITTWLTLRHQRALAEEERISSRRANAYIRLLEHQHTDPGFSEKLPPKVASRLLAFGSAEVNQALQDVRAAARPGSQSGSFDQAIDALVSQVRRELQGKPDSAPLRTSTRWQ
jgi:hypothetical protein